MVLIMTGFIYILKNEYCHDLLHIGYTHKNPSDLAEELSTSVSIPGKFLVEYQLRIPECYKAKELIHINLNHYRDKKEIEFFNIPLDYAKHMVKNIAICVIKENIIQIENEIEEGKRRKLCMS
jgi:hypothetical protein